MPEQPSADDVSIPAIERERAWTEEDGAVSRFGLPGVRTRDVGARPRVGLFGHLGSGNIGNDASLEAMLKYLSADQPGAILDAMCPGPRDGKGPLRRPGHPAALAAA